MTLSLSEAQELAQQVLDARSKAVPLALAFAREYPSSYVFTFNSRVWVETGAAEHALAGGAGPIVIRKADGGAFHSQGDEDIDELLGEHPLTDWIRVARI